MYFSRHNILSKIAGSDDYILVNLLTGNADIVSSKEAAEIERGDITNTDDYVRKGYLIEPSEEVKLFRQKYLEFLETRDNDEIQIFFVTNYTCNFGCSYCYQNEYEVSGKALSPEITDAFFHYLDLKFKGRKKYITLFGGEPLLPSVKQKSLINNFIEKTIQAGIDLAVVTNGFHLTAYLPVFEKARVREIQVTLDGTESMHNKRRPLKNGGSTFRQITEAIDKTLEKGIPLNLRVVLDKQNIDNLPDLAHFAIDRGWTSNPLFKTQLGRNYELHYCQAGNSHLFSRIGIYKYLYNLIRENPHILQFHKPACSVTKFLSEEGKLPFPLYDSCPGTKTEWAFDYTGKIYSCTATVGKKGEELGTYYPEIYLDEKIVSHWEDRDILSVPECKECHLQLACGGGCASVAKNRSGQILSPDCRPVKELIGIGAGIYF